MTSLFCALWGSARMEALNYLESKMKIKMKRTVVFQTSKAPNWGPGIFTPSIGCRVTIGCFWPLMFNVSFAVSKVTSVKYETQETWVASRFQQYTRAVLTFQRLVSSLDNMSQKIPKAHWSWNKSPGFFLVDPAPHLSSFSTVTSIQYQPE